MARGGWDMRNGAYVTQCGGALHLNNFQQCGAPASQIGVQTLPPDALLPVKAVKIALSGRPGV
jgi:hypothetical protein